MITTFNGCYCSDLKVHPKNWKDRGASCKKDWYIQYRFYDPEFRDDHGKLKPKLVIIKGMNTFKTLAERRDITDALLKNELDILQKEGYNHITRQYMAPVQEEINYEIDPSTPFIQALESASKKLIVVSAVINDIENIIKKIDIAAKQLRVDQLVISKITRRHIKLILEQCSKNSTSFSNYRFNAYRGYLMMLFKELVELEAVPANPIRDISKKPVTKKIKVVLNADQRKAVDDHLNKVFPRFREFVHLFFHSGGRKTELLQLKPGMVDLKNQKYRCIVKKRKQYAEVDRTIKTIALPYWEYFLKDCPPDQFIFGPLLKPGSKAMGKEMPTIYWKRYVKDEKQGLGIDVDFYALKHLNSTEVVDRLDEGAAADLNGHTTTAMVKSIYDVGQAGRNHDRLKKVQNKFA